MKGQISNSQELSPLIFQALDIYGHVFCFYFSPWTFSVAEGHGHPLDGRPARSGRPELPVHRIFFQKVCGFQARISCSQSFLLKDLWFWSSAFRSTGPGPSVGISCSQSFLSKDMWFPGAAPISGRTVATDSS